MVYNRSMVVLHSVGITHKHEHLPGCNNSPVCYMFTHAFCPAVPANCKASKLAKAVEEALRPQGYTASEGLLLARQHKVGLIAGLDRVLAWSLVKPVQCLVVSKVA